MKDHKIVEQIKADVGEEELRKLLDYPNAEGYGFGYRIRDGEIDYDEICIIVEVTSKVPEDELDEDAKLPETFHGYPVDVKGVDRYEPDAGGVPIDEFGPVGDRGEPQRPVLGGLDVGSDHAVGCSLGGVFEDEDGDIVALTNEHCMCDGADGCEGNYAIQPGENAGGSYPDVSIGYVKDADDAYRRDMAIVDLDVEGTSANFTVGPVGEWEDVRLGEWYINNGRSWGYRGAICIQTGGLNVDDHYRRPEDEPWGGHSGSLWGRLDSDGVFHPTSLHWGSVAEEGYGVANPRSEVFSSFGELEPIDDTHQPSGGAFHDTRVEAAIMYPSIREHDHDLIVRTLVANTGEDMGTGGAVVELVTEGGSVIDETDVFLDQWESEIIEFEIDPGWEGLTDVYLRTWFEGDLHSNREYDWFDDFPRVWLDVEITDTTDPVEPGEELEGGIRVENDEDDAYQRLEVYVNDELVDTQQTGWVESGEIAYYSFFYEAETSDIGTNTVRVESEDTSDEQEFVVEAPAVDVDVEVGVASAEITALDVVASIDQVVGVPASVLEPAAGDVSAFGTKGDVIAVPSATATAAAVEQFLAVVVVDALPRYLRYDGDEHVPLTEADIDRDFDHEEIARVFVQRDLIGERDLESGETEVQLVASEEQDDDDAWFGGVVRDLDRQGAVSEVLVESFERYASDAEPSPGGHQFGGVADSEIVHDALSRVEQLEAGEIETIQSDLSMVFNHASPAKQIREVAKTTGAEVVYRPDQTVDYLERRGRDRSETTIGPSSRNIKGSFDAEIKSGDEDISHLRMLGAGEGVHQLAVEFVPDDDPYDYEGDDDHPEVVRYDSDHWDRRERVEWTIRSDKDQVDVSGLKAIGESIIEDVQEDHVEVKTTIEGERVELGDSLIVHYPDENIFSQPVRVVEMEAKIDSTGVEYDVTMSSRRESREDLELTESEDVASYNMALDGAAVPINAGGGRQPVSEDHNYLMKFYYPDEVEFNHRLNVRVMGLNYRAYSQGAAAGGGDFTTTTAGGHHADSTAAGGFVSDTTADGGFDFVADTTTHEDVEFFETTAANSPHGVQSSDIREGIDVPQTDGDWETIETISGIGPHEVAEVYFSASSTESTLRVRLYDPEDSRAYPTDADTGLELASVSGDDDRMNTSIRVPKNASFFNIEVRTSNVDPQCELALHKVFWGRHTHDLYLQDEHNHEIEKEIPDHDHQFEVPEHTHEFEVPEHTHEVEIDDHEHPPDPGIIDFNEWPEDCDVIVNGQSADVSLGDGDGDFTETVNLLDPTIWGTNTPPLQEGEVNVIEVTSENLGHIQAWAEGDTYRQVLGDG